MSFDWQNRGEIAQALGVFMAFSLSISTALVNVALLLLLIGYVASGDFAGKWGRIRSNPVAMASLVLFLLFLIGVFYSTAGIKEGFSVLNSYRELLLLPIVISLFTSDKWRRRAYFAFLIVISIGVLLSYAIWLGWLPQGSPGHEMVPFRGRISFSFFMAFATYLMLHHAIAAQSTKHRIMWLGIALLAIIDQYYLVTSRTGHVVMLVLLLFLLFQHRSVAVKHWLVVSLAFVAFVAVVATTSPAVSERSGDLEMAETNPEASSVGLRLIFWKASLGILADNPILGAGTGSYEHEFTSHAGEHSHLYANNAHNEYLMVASQLGLLGLAGFLWLFYCMYRYAGELTVEYSRAAQGLVVAMCVGCMFNSFLRDLGEGHFFAVYAGLLFSSFVPGKRAVSEN